MEVQQVLQGQMRCDLDVSEYRQAVRKAQSCRHLPRAFCDDLQWPRMMAAAEHHRTVHLKRQFLANWNEEFSTRRWNAGLIGNRAARLNLGSRKPRSNRCSAA